MNDLSSAVTQLRAQNDDTAMQLRRENADLLRQNMELREAIVALMEPEMPRVLLGRTGVIVLDKAWVKPTAPVDKCPNVVGTLVTTSR
jgi:hypothetical protein